MGASDPFLFNLDDIRLEDIEPWQVDHVGAELAAARTAKGVTVEALAAELKVRSVFITALEAGRYSDLPGLPYAVGYVRSIADHLGLDGKTYAERLKDQQGHEYVAPTLSLPEPKEIREGGSSKALLAAISIALGTLGYGGWLLYSQQDMFGSGDVVATQPAPAEPNAVRNVPAATQAARADGATKAPATATGAHATALAMPKPADDRAVERTTDRGTTAGPTRVETLAPAASIATRPEAAKPKPAPLADAKITLEARGLTWVHLKDAKGATVVAGAKKKGWRFTVPDRPGLRLTVGRADQLVILVGSRALPPLRADSKPVRNLPLDAKALREKARALPR
jgi:cytoskeleton protein RodZ